MQKVAERVATAKGAVLLVESVMANRKADVQTFVNTIRSALNSVNPQVPFVDSSPSNQIQATDPYTKRYTPHPASPRILNRLYHACSTFSVLDASLG